MRRSYNLLAPFVSKPANKYKAERQVVGGHSFDSKKEARRYGELKLLMRAGEISDLEVHPRYALTVSGERIGHAEFDFRYRTKSGLLVIEDCKSEPTNTALSKWKRRHFQIQYELMVTLT